MVGKGKDGPRAAEAVSREVEFGHGVDCFRAGKWVVSRNCVWMNGGVGMTHGFEDAF